MGRKKVDPLLKRIPLNKSVKRGIILAFDKTCNDLGVSPNDVVENMIVNFINDIQESKREIKNESTDEPIVNIKQ